MNRVIRFVVLLIGYSSFIGCDGNEPVPQLEPLRVNWLDVDNRVNANRARHLSEKISDVRAKYLPVLFDQLRIRSLLAIVEYIGNMKDEYYVATVISESRIIRLEVGENWYNIVQYEENDRVMKELRKACKMLHNYNGETLPSRSTAPFVFVTLYKGSLPSSVFYRDLPPSSLNYMQAEFERTKNKYSAYFYELLSLLSKLKEIPCKNVDLSRIGFYTK